MMLHFSTKASRDLYEKPVALVFGAVQGKTVLLKEYRNNLDDSTSVESENATARINSTDPIYSAFEILYDKFNALLDKYKGKVITYDRGDFYCAFPVVENGIRFSLDLQRNLLSCEWPDSLPINGATEVIFNGTLLLFRGLRIRCGIHVGVIPWKDDCSKQNLAGMAAKLGALASSAAAGGVIVLTKAAETVLCGMLSNNSGNTVDVETRSLGSFTVTEQEHVELFELFPIELVGRRQHISSPCALPKNAYFEFSTMRQLSRPLGLLTQEDSNSTETKSNMNDPLSSSTAEQSCSLFSEVKFSENDKEFIDMLLSMDVEDILEKRNYSVDSFNENRNWTFSSYKSFSIGPKIVHGAMVFKGKWKYSNNALEKGDTVELHREVIPKTTIEREKWIRNFMSTCDMLSLFRHENIIETGIQLNDALSNKNIDISWIERSKLAHGVIKAVSYLHGLKPPIIHRDLKSSVVRVCCPNGNAKIVDFPYLRSLNMENVLMSMVGTSSFVAPEVSSGKPYGLSADIYNIALILYEIASRETPWAGLSFTTIYKKVLNDERPVVQSSWPSPFVKVMTECWCTNPCERPTAEELNDRFKSVVQDLGSVKYNEGSLFTTITGKKGRRTLKKELAAYNSNISDANKDINTKPKIQKKHSSFCAVL